MGEEREKKKKDGANTKFNNRLLPLRFVKGLSTKPLFLFFFLIYLLTTHVVRIARSEQTLQPRSLGAPLNLQRRKKRESKAEELRLAGFTQTELSDREI